MSDAGTLRAHPDFLQRPPERATVGGFDLAPLTTAITKEDFGVVTSSAGTLRGLLGDDWPHGLTLETNAIDLAWHEREFAARRSFAWVLRGGRPMRAASTSSRAWASGARRTRGSGSART